MATSTTPALSPNGPAYTYRAEAKRVYDGDTFVASVDLGFEVFAAVRVRLRNVNAPELNNRPAGEQSRDYLARLLLPSGGPPAALLVRSFARSFERWVCDVWVRDRDAWVNVAEQIITAGQGSPYPDR